MTEIKLTKPKAKTTIFIYPDKEDEWFINISHRTKSGKETKKHTIIKKDLEKYIESLKGEGWTQ